MSIKLEKLQETELDLFIQAEKRAFSVHARYFPDGIIPGISEEDAEGFDLRDMIHQAGTTTLAVKDDGKFVGGAVVNALGDHKYEIDNYFLTNEYQSKGFGKAILEMIEAYFPDAECFSLVTPSQVVRNTVFYVNKCGYHITKVVGYDKESNSADYIFEKWVK